MNAWVSGYVPLLEGDGAIAMPLRKWMMLQGHAFRILSSQLDERKDIGVNPLNDKRDGVRLLQELRADPFREHAARYRRPAVRKC